MKKPEKLCRGEGPRYRRWLKRMRRRLARRAWRTMGEDAPRRPWYHGYST